MPQYFMALVCVFGLAIGQILFKACANEVASPTGGITARAVTLLLAAMFLYGVITLAWVWLLRTAELGKIYPFMALAFIIVPLGSHYFFGEIFSPRYFAGVTLIVAGIIVTYIQA